VIEGESDAGGYRSRGADELAAAWAISGVILLTHGDASCGFMGALAGYRYKKLGRLRSFWHHRKIEQFFNTVRRMTSTIADQVAR
jgi:hypothetical protein